MLNNTKLTNSQLMSLIRGFGLFDNMGDGEDLYDAYISLYFDIILKVWKDRTFHTAESILAKPGLYPSFANTHKLLETGAQWLSEHKDADRAVYGIIEDNLDSTARKERVQKYNQSL